MEMPDFSRREWILILLSAVSGLIHLYLGVWAFDGDLQFTLAGLGFFGAIGLYTREKFRNLVLLAGLPFVGYQMYAYYNFYSTGPFSVTFTPLGAVDKLAQALIILLLLWTIYDRKEQML